MSAAFTLTPDEANERLAASVTSYGLGTRSYNHSPEKRELDRQRATATAAYEDSPREAVEVEGRCPCPQRPYPHELSAHSQLRYEGNRDRWPWSLMLSPRVEPSTDRTFGKAV